LTAIPTTYIIIRKLKAFLVVTKNHVSPGINPGLFLLEQRKKAFIEL